MLLSLRKQPLKTFGTPASLPGKPLPATRSSSVGQMVRLHGGGTAREVMAYGER